MTIEDIEKHWLQTSKGIKITPEFESKIIDFMALTSETLIELGFTHQERLKIFYFIKKHPRKTHEFFNFCKTSRTPGQTNDTYKQTVLKKFSIK